MKKRFIMIGLALALLIAIVVVTSGNVQGPRPGAPGEKAKDVMNELIKRVDDLESRVSDIEEALLLAGEDEAEGSEGKEEKEKGK